MNSLSQINQGGLGHYDHYAMSSNESAVNSYESLNAGLTIKTREGDVVTLTASRSSGLDAYEYSSRGEFSSKRSNATATYNEREITLSSGERFTFNVRGDLNEDELKDIESIVSGVDEIIGEMAEGDMEDAVAKALSMGSYDSISRYEAEIRHEQSYESYAENRATYEGRRGRGRGRRHGYGRAEASAIPRQDAVLPKADEQTTDFMDKVTTLLEAQKEETVAWAKQPLSQLFNHHMNALKPTENINETASDATEETAPTSDTVAEVADVVDGTKNTVSANEITIPAKQEQIPEEQPFYTFLEDVAARVDELINSMMRDLFGNMVDRVI